MAEEVGTAFVSILPSLRGFSARLRQELRGELATVDGPAVDAGHRAGTSFSHAMAGRIGAASAAIGGAVRTALLTGAAAAIAGLGAITGFGLKSAAQLEQTQIGFEALLGSAEAAQTTLEDLQRFAATTPFEFQGIADAGRRILAFGTSVGITRDELIPTLTTIGDLVSVLGGTQESIDSVVRAFGQMSSKGKVSQEELLQLAEALPGFNANAAIAASLGLSVADSMEAITAGEVSAQEGIDGLLAGMAAFPGAAGAMEKQALTLAGVFSTFKDTMSIALTNAFQPVIPEVKSALTGVTPVFEDVLNQLAPKLGELLTLLLPLMGILTQALTPILLPILDGIGVAIDALMPAIEPLGAAFGQVVAAMLPLIPPLAEFINALVQQGLVPTLLQLVPVLGELIPPLTQLLVALMPIIPPLGQILAAVVGLLVPLASLIALVLGWVVGLADAIGVFDALAAILGVVASAVGALTGWLSSLFDFDLAAEWARFTAQVTGAWDTVVGFFRDLPGRITAFLTNLPSMLVDLAQKALNALAFAVGFGIGATIAFFRDLPGNIAALVTDLWDRVRSLFTSGVDNAKTTVSNGVSNLIEQAKALPGRFMTAIRELPGQLASFASEMFAKAKQLGIDIVNGVVSGIRSVIGTVKDTLLGGFRSAVDGVKRGLGIASPSKVFAAIGEDTIAGYVKGVEDSAKQARFALTAALTPAGSDTTIAAPPAAEPTTIVDNVIQIGDEVTRVVRTEISDSNRQLRRRAMARTGRR